MPYVQKGCGVPHGHWVIEVRHTTQPNTIYPLCHTLQDIYSFDSIAIAEISTQITFPVAQTNVTKSMIHYLCEATKVNAIGIDDLPYIAVCIGNFLKRWWGDSSVIRHLFPKYTKHNM